MKLQVIRNTFPTHPGVARGEVGDVVEWRPGRKAMHLERVADDRSIFSRDCRPKGVIDTRPIIGIIAHVKCRGWVLEIGEGKPDHVKDNL